MFVSCVLIFARLLHRAAGGGPESRACCFKPAEDDGVSASGGMLELAGYPDLSWEFRRAGGANLGFVQGEVRFCSLSAHFYLTFT